MIACKARLLIVLGVALIPGAALALSPSPPPPDSAQAVVDDAGDFDADAWQEKRDRSERELFDALRADPSPRRQVLTGRIYLSDEDEGTPAALRPSSDDVVARAANLTPDDAFVQWAAASEGNYFSSQCGPTHWPEAEVANLLRLEPDNAAAWQFAVALAHAKGDQAGLDQALAQMAGARRADDHLGEEIALWTQVYTTSPDAVAAAFPFGADDSATPSSNALRGALQRTTFRFSPTASAIETACKPDGSTEQSWQRIGWCADAGNLLATKGNSLGLRELGLKMLTASGNAADSAELQRQFDWLQANGGMVSMYNDSPTDLLADWQGATSEIEATERRLARLGKPTTAPAGWVKGGHDGSESDARESAMETAIRDHVQALIDDLRSSADVREHALGLASANPFSLDAGKDDVKAPDETALAQLAATHSDDPLVQWLASGDNTPTIDEALQRLDPDNAAVWALSLDRSGNDAAATTRVLVRMAGTTRHATPDAEIHGLWLALARRHPPSPELVADMASMSDEPATDGEAVGRGLAMMMASMTLPGRSSSIDTACGERDKQTMAARKDACIAIGRLLLHDSGSSNAAASGESVLRKLDALDARDGARARQLAWWRNAVMRHQQGDDSQRINTYIDDLLATGSEIEALRLAAERLGKGIPPADWQSPAEKRVAKTRASAG